MTFSLCFFFLLLHFLPARPSNSNFRLADCVTLGNGFCGSLSIFASAKFLITQEEKYLWCVFLPVPSNSSFEKSVD
jgi:hypothetical protein